METIDHSRIHGRGGGGLQEKIAYQNSCWFRGVGITIDSSDCCFLSSLAAPPTPICDKEELLFCKIAQTGEQSIRRSIITFLPCMKCGCKASCISDVLTQSEATIHMERLRVRPWNGEISILIDKALSPCFKGFDCFIIPPVGIIPTLIIMPTG